MAKVVTDDRFYKEIAETIREGRENDVLCKPESMANEIKSAFSQQFSKGTAFGKYEADQENASKYFSQVVKGTGTDSLTFYVPFEPDTICVSCHDPDLRAVKGIVTIIQIEPCAFGKIAGSYCLSNGPLSSTGTGLGSYVTGLNPLGSISDRYTRDENGYVTLRNFVTTTSNPISGFFGENVDYIVTAVKVVEKTLKERITEAINRLPSNPAQKYSIDISKAKKELAFPDNTEWNNLLAKAPANQYTFTLF